MKEMVGGCCVCSDERGWDENPLVYCDGHGCNVAVHQACYGIVQVPSGPWFCRKCESQERIARVKCELCPSREGALKRSDNGGWCHVICALFIPEVQFGSVDTMEPVIIANIRPDRFGKLCYICEEQGRGTRASSGACMQCNKSGCKMHFHVTCAQAMGMLCEETGHYNDNVKYCGYCATHYKKLKKDTKDSNIKTIPAFKPVGTPHATPETTPEKAGTSPRSPIKPLVGCKARDKIASQGKEWARSTPAAHKDHSARDDKEPKMKEPKAKEAKETKTKEKEVKEVKETKSPKEEKVVPIKEDKARDVDKSPAKNSNEHLSSPIHLSPKFTTANFVETTISPKSEEKREEKKEVVEKKDEKKKKLTRTDSFSSGSTESPVDIDIVKPQPQLTPLTVVIKKEAILETSKEVKVKDGNLLPIEKTDSTLLVTTAPSSQAPGTITLTAVLTGNRINTTASTSIAMETNSKDSKDARAKIAAEEDRKAKFSTTFENFLNSYNMENPPDPELLKERPGKRQKSKSSDKRKSKKSKHGEHELTRTKIECSDSNQMKQSSEYDWPMSSPSASATPASTLPGQRPSTSATPTMHAGSISSESVVNGFSSNAAGPMPPTQRHRLRQTTQTQAQPFPTSLEQLLERQWEQGSQFILEQAQHFDIASLLTCLHQLKSENTRLEEYISNLTARRDSLLAINARLTLPMDRSRSPRNHATTNDHDHSAVRSPTLTSQPVVNGDVPSLHHTVTNPKGRGQPRTPERRPSGGQKKPTTTPTTPVTSHTDRSSSVPPIVSHPQESIQMQIAQHLQLLHQHHVFPTSTTLTTSTAGLFNAGVYTDSVRGQRTEPARGQNKDKK